MTLRLTTLAELKRFMDITESTWDTLLGDILDSVGNQLETLMQRKLLDTGSDVTEYKSIERCQSIVYVNRYPIVSVTSVKEDYLREFGSGTLLDSSDYFTSEDQGLIEKENSAFYPGNKTVQVVYRGGYLTDGEGALQGIPEAWKLASNQQCTHVFQRRQSPGATTINHGGGGSQTVGDTGLIKGVRELILPYRRILI